MKQFIVRELRVNGIGPISFVLAAGERVFISGASGSGKSLILRALADLELHDGEAYLDGVACQDIPAPRWRRQVAYLPPRCHWWRDRVGPHFDMPRTLPALPRLGLSHSILEADVGRLSSGESQRLALLRLLSLHPKVALLDEPTASLDPENVARVERLIIEYCDSGLAVVWVSHDRAQIARLADHHFVLEQGRLREETRS